MHHRSMCSLRGCNIGQLPLLVVVHQRQSNSSKGQGHLNLGYWVGASSLDPINDSFIWGKYQGSLESVNECLPVCSVDRYRIQTETHEGWGTCMLIGASVELCIFHAEGASIRLQKWIFWLEAHLYPPTLPLLPLWLLSESEEPSSAVFSPSPSSILTNCSEKLSSISSQVSPMPARGGGVCSDPVTGVVGVFGASILMLKDSWASCNENKPHKQLHYWPQTFCAYSHSDMKYSKCAVETCYHALSNQFLYMNLYN